MNLLVKLILSCFNLENSGQENPTGLDNYQEMPPRTEEFSFGLPSDQKSSADEVTEVNTSRPSIS